MKSDESMRFWKATVQERFEVYGKFLERLLQHLPLNDNAKKVEAANGVIDRLNDLINLFAPSVRPSWFEHFRSQLEEYIRRINNSDAGLLLLKYMLGQSGKMILPTLDSQRKMESTSNRSLPANTRTRPQMRRFNS